MSVENINREYSTISSRFELSVEKYHRLVLSQLEWPSFAKNIRIFDVRDLGAKDLGEEIGAFWGEMDFMAEEGIVMYRRSQDFFTWVVLDEEAYKEHYGRWADEDAHCHILNKDGLINNMRRE